MSKRMLSIGTVETQQLHRKIGRLAAVTTVVVWLAGLIYTPFAPEAADGLLPPDTGTSPRVASAKQIQGPHVVFESASFDFGRVDAGKIVKHEYSFRNTGDAALEILEVRASCGGCTTTGDWQRRVNPGEKGVIPVQLDTRNCSGAVTKTISVRCNDPVQTRMVLVLKGLVWRPVEIIPPAACFIAVNGEEAPEIKTLRIVNKMDEPLTLCEPECAPAEEFSEEGLESISQAVRTQRSTNCAFRAELVVIKPGKEFELKVTSCPPFDSAFVESEIKMRTSSSRAPTLSVRAFVAVQQPVLATPKQITVSRTALRQGTQSAIMIRNSGKSPLALSDITINVRHADVKLQELQAGRLFRLVATFPPTTEIGSDTNYELRVKTNNPQFPTIRIPIAMVTGAPLQSPTGGLPTP